VGEPHLIEGGEWLQPILRGLAPERECFLALVAVRKCMMAQEEDDQALQCFGLGIRYAGLLILHAASMHADLRGQRDLRQREPASVTAVIVCQIRSGIPIYAMATHRWPPRVGLPSLAG
jgi:hypothetical protein